VAVQIKRYANRKLYNTETSRYITLGGISELVSAGREIRVVDNETGKDISSLVLSRVLVDTEKRGAPGPGDAPDGSGAPDATPVLGELIQRQVASLYALLRRYAEDVQGNLSGVRDNVVRWIQSSGTVPDSLCVPDSLSAPQAAGAPEVPAPEPVDDVVTRALRRAVSDLDLPTRSDLARLQEQVDRLATSLETLRTGRET